MWESGDQLRVPYKNRAFKFLSYLAIISVLNQPVVHSRYVTWHGLDFML
jgi:hypothetical protein